MIEVTVVITCYNKENYISEAIKSVLNQTNTDVIKELIIVDDGSEDNSRNVIDNIYEEKHKVPIIRIYQSNKGAAEARNSAIKAAQGNYIALLDGDDIWVKHKIDQQVKVLKKFPTLGILYSDYYEKKNKRSRKIYAKHYDINDKNVQKKIFLYGGPILLSTVIINKKCFDKVGYFDPDIRISQDTDLWLRISGEFRIHHLKEPLVYKRIVDTSLSSNYGKKREYLLDGIDKIVKIYPELEPLKNKRIAELYLRTGRIKLVVGKRLSSIEDILYSIHFNPLKIKSYIFLVLAFLPVKGSWYKYFFNKLATMKKYGIILKTIR